VAGGLPPHAKRRMRVVFALLGARWLVESAATALSERGQGFEVGCSYGSVVVPGEARTESEALQVADRRLYRQKSSRRDAPRAQTRDVLMRVLEEREPALREHVRGVAEMATAVGERLGLTTEELDELARAAELHDVGKMAIPDAILDKPEGLDDQETAFIRRHTLIGEGILSAAPALVPVAKLVRSSHERYDGTGYPDGLSGDDIPLGARVIFACDAFDAITADRAYSPRRSPKHALAELVRHAGTQFDPLVVKAVAEVVAEGRVPVARETAADIPITLPGWESFRPA